MKFYSLGKGQKISKAIFLETPSTKRGPKFFEGFLPKPLKWDKSKSNKHKLYYTSFQALRA